MTVSFEKITRCAIIGTDWGEFSIQQVLLTMQPELVTAGAGTWDRTLINIPFPVSGESTPRGTHQQPDGESEGEVEGEREAGRECCWQN